MKRLLSPILCVLLLVSVVSAWAKVDELAPEASLVEVYVKSYEDALPLIHLGLDICSGKAGEYYHILAFNHQIQQILDLGYEMRVLIEDVSQHNALTEGKGYQGYHYYDELRTEMQQLASDYPDIVSFHDLGTSWQDNQLMAWKISDKVAEEEGEPVIFFVGCHHAREPMSVEVPFYCLKWLVENYGTDRVCAEIIDNLEIWVMPMENPDGHIYDGYAQYGYQRWWRKNCRDNNDSGSFEPSIDGVDLNRNYTYMWGYDDYGSSPSWSSSTYRGPYAGSEPETQIVMNLVEEKDAYIVISYHSYGEYILMPWGYIYDYPDPPHYELFWELADGMNDVLDEYYHKYIVGNCIDTCGYPCNGDTIDWTFGDGGDEAQNQYCLTFELNSSYQGGFYPDDSYIQPTCEYHYEVIKWLCQWLVDESTTDILITDFTAQPKMNQVNLSWWAETTQDEHILGFNLYRKVGAHSMETPLNYTQKTEEFIKINHALITGQNPYSFTDSGLTPMTHYTYILETVIEEGMPPAPSTTSTTTLSPSTFAIASVYPLPADDSATVEFMLDQPSEVQLALYDISGRLTCIVFADYLDAGEHRRVMETAGLSSGVYILELRSMDRSSTRAVVVAH